MKVKLSMTQNTLLNMLKISITIGLCLIALGIYLHLFSEKMHQLGVTGIIISATCIAIGFIFSLPTKIFLTILLMKREADIKAAHTPHNETKSHYKGCFENSIEINSVESNIENSIENSIGNSIQSSVEISVESRQNKNQHKEASYPLHNKKLN